MFKGLANIASLMKQASQMSAKMQQVNEILKTKRASGAAGGGMVEVEVNGLGEVLRVKIDQNLIDQQDREMIEDLLPGAVNQAITRAKQLHVEAVKEVAGDLDVPGLDDALAQFAGGASGDPSPKDEE